MEQQVFTVVTAFLGHAHVIEHAIPHERCRLSRAGLVACLLDLMSHGADASELPRLRREVEQAPANRYMERIAGADFDVS